MGNEKVDVLAGELRITRTEYTPGITTAIAEAVMDCPAGTYWIIPDEARAAVAELIGADKEFDKARDDYYRSRGAIYDFGAEKAFDKAVARRAAALARCQGEMKDG